MRFKNPRSLLSNVSNMKKCQILYEIENMQNDIIIANSIEDIVENKINRGQYKSQIVFMIEIFIMKSNL